MPAVNSPVERNSAINNQQSVISSGPLTLNTGYLSFEHKHELHWLFSPLMRSVPDQRDEWAEQGDWLEAIQRLKKAGKIRFFGVSINDNQPENAIRLIETGAVDTVQVIHNIFEQAPEDRLYPACERHQVGVIVRVPFDEGGLTGKITPDTKFDSADFRSRYFRGDRKQQVYDRVQKIVSDLGITLDQMADFALRYVLSYPAVSTVIPGMRSFRNVEANCRAGDGKGLSKEQANKLKAHRWERNFYG